MSHDVCDTDDGVEFEVIDVAVRVDRTGSKCVAHDLLNLRRRELFCDDEVQNIEQILLGYETVVLDVVDSKGEADFVGFGRIARQHGEARAKIKETERVAVLIAVSVSVCSAIKLEVLSKDLGDAASERVMPQIYVLHHRRHRNTRNLRHSLLGIVV